MADRRWKPVLFTAVLIIAFTLLLLIFVHRAGETRLCPPDEVYHGSGSEGEGQEGKCHRLHSQGSCPRNMILFQNTQNASVGRCDCDFLHHQRGLIYHEESDECFFLFHQGYCAQGEWLVPSLEDCKLNLCAQCERNPCPSDSHFSPGSEWVMLKDGQCRALGSPCDLPGGGGGGGSIRFLRGKSFPTCATDKEDEKMKNRFVFSGAGIGVPPVACPPGYARTFRGTCAPAMDF